MGRPVVPVMISCKDCGIMVERWPNNRFLCASCAKERILAYQRKARRERYARNKEKYLTIQRARYSENVEKERAYQKKWRDKNRDEMLTRRRMKYALSPELHRDRVKRWQRDNPDKKKALRERWKRNNPEKFKQMKKASTERNKKTRISYLARNVDRSRAVHKLWAEKNMHKILSNNRRHRARKLRSDGRHTDAEFFELCERHGWKCSYCQMALTKKNATRDHKVPLTRGGSDWIQNISPCCAPCNSSKKTRTAEEFIAAGGRQIC